MNEKPERPTPPAKKSAQDTAITAPNNETRTAAEIRSAKKAEKSIRPWFKKKRFWLLGVTAIFVVVGIFQGEPKESDNTTLSEQSESESDISEDESPQSRLAAAILKETGKSNIKGYGNRIQLVEWSAEQTLIRLLGDENISSGLTKSSNRRLVLETIAAYQDSGLSSEIIAVEVFYPLLDNLGNYNFNRVLGYGFTQERILRIRPENIDIKQMDSNFADLFTVIHPTFRW